MKKRNLVTVVLLTIVTLGIYGLYWTYATRKELLALEKDPKAIPDFGLLLLPFLTPLLIFPLALMMPTSEGQEPSVLAVLLPVLTIFAVSLGSIALYCWWFYHYCKVASKVSQGIEFMPSYILFLVCLFVGWPIIWEALIQNDFNKVADRLQTKKKVPASTPQKA